MRQKTAMTKLILAMCIFGTIGIFRRMLPYPSGMIACARAVIGAAFLFLLLVMRRHSMDQKMLKKYLVPLLASGICLGGNWVLLFEAYRHATVAVATVCYYMAPVFAMLAAAIFFRERLTGKKIFCILLACGGMLLVSGILDTQIKGVAGILFGLGAAVLYAAVMLLGRFLTEIDSYDRTIVQLLVSVVAVGIYSLVMEEPTKITFCLRSHAIILLLIIGVLHTGIAYALYFDSIGKLPTQTVAIFSFLDPVVSIILSVFFLQEPLTLRCICGMCMILGSAVFNEVTFGRKVCKSESIREKS